VISWWGCLRLISIFRRSKKILNMRKHMSLYIGSYSYSGSRGIYYSRLDLADGTLIKPELKAELADPGFLRVDEAGRVLFCNGNSRSDTLPAASAVSFRIRHNGNLELLGRQIDPDLKFCHISCSPDYGALLGADYGHGRVAVFPIEKDGGISEVRRVIDYDDINKAMPERQGEPHVHSVNFDVSGDFVFVCNFSGDKVEIYSWNGASQRLCVLGSMAVDSGSGPRHLVCHPNGKNVYIINELAGTIVSAVFEGGSLSMLGSISTLPPDFRGDNAAAEILLSPDARFLYATNRGDDSIAWYRLDAETNLPEVAGFVSSAGEHPRNMVIDPSGKFMLVANRDSNNVAVFKLKDGRPVFSGNTISLAAPMGMVFV